MLADWGEIAQFLQRKRMVLDEQSRKLFLDYLYRGLLRRRWSCWLSVRAATTQRMTTRFGFRHSRTHATQVTALGNYLSFG